MEFSHVSTRSQNGNRATRGGLWLSKDDDLGRAVV